MSQRPMVIQTILLKEPSKKKKKGEKKGIFAVFSLKSGIPAVLFPFNHFLFVILNLVTFSRKDFDKKAIKRLPFT